jgi:hypothetical protein
VFHDTINTEMRGRVATQDEIWMRTRPAPAL